MFVNFIKRFYILLIFLFILCPLRGQDTLFLSCKDAISIALGESYSIRSYQVERQAMQHYFSYYKAMFKPRLDMSLNTPLWEEAISTIDQPNGLPVYNSTGSLQAGGNLKFTYVLPSGGDLSLSANMFRENLSTILASDKSKLKTDQFYSYVGVTLNQPIFTKNTLRENLKEAEFRLEKSEHYYTRAQMDIVYQVTQEFYALYRNRKQVEIAAEKLKNSEESYRVARLKAKTGRIALGDEMSAEVSVAQNKAACLKAVNQFQNEEDKFKQLIGIDLNKKIGILTDLGYVPLVIDEQKAIDEALKNRLELKETEMDINLQQIDVDRARREREFKGYISAYYDLTGISTLGSGTTSELMQSSFEDVRNRPPNRGVALTLTFPIYDWGRGASKVKEARLRLQSRQLFKEDQEITIRVEVREIIRSVKESAEQLDIHRQNLELARQSFHISQMRFENGDISNQELTMEQERLATIQLEYLDAFIGYQLAMNDLKRKTMWDFETEKSYVVSGD
jgi:outer membrane protein